MELELAIKAAGGLDADHGILGGTLPSDRSPLRGNRFPAPSAYRQDRELAEAAHALAGEVGLRQAANRLGIHRDALKAAFGQWRWRGGWAGSPAASWQTAPKPSGPSPWPNSSAASTPPPPSWAPPGRRCARPSPATALACRPATPKPSDSAPWAAASRRAGQPTPGLDPVFVALNPGVLPAGERSPAELYQWVRREEQYATLGTNMVVEPNSESHARKSTTRAWAIIRLADRNHRLAGQRTSRPDRRHADEPTAPAVPPTPGAGDGGRCPLTLPARISRTASSGLRCVYLDVPGP